ncbi:MAG: hypothetical protein COV66_03990 [Nitrospinae bacterium CG11_big_fil_rev_8_21_14_0_20_45_15]|nr:MAG: hypothetical protein COV66_03990 [Nitrospinae bacterium CG11_big_fil_rev_8_21_14_0_20_45_15]
MLINDLTSNILKILSGESGTPTLDPAFIKSLNLGQILTATVLKTFAGNQALVDFGGHKALSQTSSSVTVGQKVQVRAERLNSAPVFKIIDEPPLSPPRPADSLTINSSKQTRSDTAPPPSSPIKISEPETFNRLNLKSGETVEGKVIASHTDTQVKTGSRVEVAFKGQEFEVRLPENQAKSGDVVTLKANGNNSFDLLIKNSSEAEANSSPSVSTAMIKSYLLSKSPLIQLAQNLTSLLETIPSDIKVNSDLLVRLKEILEVIVPKEGPPANADQIKNQVGTTIQSTESKIFQLMTSPRSKDLLSPMLERDLKAQLLILKAGLEAQAPQSHQRNEITTLLNALKMTADNIELNQLSHQFSKQEGQAFVLQIPNPFSGHDKQIKIFVRNKPQDEEAGNDKGRKKQNYNLVFLLHLSSLGELEIDARVSGELVSIKFGTDNEAVSQFIQSHVSQLHAVLEDLGFSGSTECNVKKEKGIEFEDDLGKMMVNSSSKLVDIET